MRELVIVFTDIDPCDGAGRAPAPPPVRGPGAPGIGRAARYGTRESVPAGWRTAVLDWLGLAGLAEVAPARMAAAVLDAAAAPGAEATAWIATPVQLLAGPAHVWLPHGGVLRLTADEQAGLAADFARTFGADGTLLTALPGGEFLLVTPHLPPLATGEPARHAGQDIAAALPQGPASGPVRRLIAELEMWLHAHPVNDMRLARGAPAVTTLWPWGATGGALPGAPLRTRSPVAAFGCDAWLDGLWHLLGGVRSGLPGDLDAALAPGVEERVLLVVQAGDEVGSEGRNGVADAIGRLDARFVAPALAALRAGRLGRVTLLGHAQAVHVGRRSHLRFWRRATGVRPGGT